ncbi:MAG: MoaD/ThiS family protein [Candidatus Melainabacteria bacterium]|nr:MoaD/ThiS family protein [Candidatus Melainabacteria bacterium]
MQVRIPSPLYSYTKNVNVVEGQGKTVLEVLDNLNVQYPGIKFRMVDEHNKIRPHMKVFLNVDEIKDLNASVSTTDKIMIVAALSGG